MGRPQFGLREQSELLEFTYVNHIALTRIPCRGGHSHVLPSSEHQSHPTRDPGTHDHTLGKFSASMGVGWLCSIGKRAS